MKKRIMAALLVTALALTGCTMSAKVGEPGSDEKQEAKQEEPAAEEGNTEEPFAGMANPWRTTGSSWRKVRV